eukprot:15457197-Alexandrium_andersonii.AAC.1
MRAGAAGRQCSRRRLQRSEHCSVGGARTAVSGAEGCGRVPANGHAAVSCPGLAATAPGSQRAQTPGLCPPSGA